MAWYDFLNINKDSKIQPSDSHPATQAESRIGGNVIVSPWYPVHSKTFNGEKTEGEMGNPIRIYPDHNGLRLRTYEAELTKDIVKMITGKFFKWCIGTGLKLQSEPVELVLRASNIEENWRDFRALVEARFEVYSHSKYSDYAKMTNLHKKAREAFQTAFLGGDCLVVLRLDKDGFVSVQVIDGEEISTPWFSNDFQDKAKARGNRIINGIEVDKRGKHVAYYVVKQDEEFALEHERIPAYGEKSGKLQAWMIYGDKHRINHVRGIPRISSILEKIDKMDRFTEATVAGAEERAKIVFSVEHNRYSTGENPVVGNIRKNLGLKEDEDPYQLGEELVKNISATTQKSTFNLPVGAKMTSLDSNQEAQYDTFFTAIFTQLCSASDIPPEVALQKYDSNYSASRAAINGWGYIVDIYRKDFSEDFYKKVYDFWLEVEILSGKIKSSGYLKALDKDDKMVIESYNHCKFVGINMPHIDPLKEVNAVRKMLGDASKGETPLISHETAAEILNQGEWSENYEKYKEEDKIIEKPKPEENGTPAKNQNQAKKLGRKN